MRARKLTGQHRQGGKRALAQSTFSPRNHAPESLPHDRFNICLISTMSPTFIISAWTAFSLLSLAARRAEFINSDTTATNHNLKQTGRPQAAPCRRHFHFQVFFRVDRGTEQTAGDARSLGQQRCGQPEKMAEIEIYRLTGFLSFFADSMPDTKIPKSFHEKFNRHILRHHTLLLSIKPSAIRVRHHVHFSPFFCTSIAQSRRCRLAVHLRRAGWRGDLENRTRPKPGDLYPGQRISHLLFRQERQSKLLGSWCAPD